ncbi:MAG: hypothetical protein ACK54T_09390 [bacterium]|jgi:uncharacterized membrane protein YjjP (DUF1212 family)
MCFDPLVLLIVLVPAIIFRSYWAVLVSAVIMGALGAYTRPHVAPMAFLFNFVAGAVASFVWTFVVIKIDTARKAKSASKTPPPPGSGV